MTTTNDSLPTPFSTPTRAAPDGCTLSPTAFDRRIAFIRREIAPHALATHRLENGIAWDFEPRPEMRARLENLARLERECCSGIEFEVSENPDGKRLRFEIIGVEADSEILGRIGPTTRQADEADPADAAADRRIDEALAATRWIPFAKRGGLAALIAVAVCCVAPIALAPVIGVAAAAPLSKLDDPFVIVGVTVGLMTMLWIFEKRRARPRQAVAKGKDVGCGC